MQVAVASGKGGTGKTTVAVSLALYLLRQGYRVRYLDCDVDAPNANNFLGLKLSLDEEVLGKEPLVDEARCTHLSCAECAKACRHGAITVLKDRVMVFHDLCTGCEVCAEVCPRDAITMVSRVMGWIERGVMSSEENPLELYVGRLKVGEAAATPLIRRLKEKAVSGSGTINLIDSPPGTGCAVLEAVRGSDRVILVTEPTEFGLYDLKRAVEVVEHLNLRAGIVVNKSGLKASEAVEGKLEALAKQHNIPILARLPHSRETAELYSEGGMQLSRYLIERYSKEFRSMAEFITSTS